MKKFAIVLLVEILLLFNLCVCLYSDIMYIYSYIISGYFYSVYAILNFIGTLTIIAAIIIVALLNLPAFQPLRDKLSARREARLQVKAEKDRAKKQEMIKDLEAVLEELKKDE